MSTTQHDLWADTRSPAEEKTLSLATDVAGTHRYLLANFDKIGYLSSFAFHHNNWLEFNGMVSSLINFVIGQFWLNYLKHWLPRNNFS